MTPRPLILAVGWLAWLPGTESCSRGRNFVCAECANDNFVLSGPENEVRRQIEQLLKLEFFIELQVHEQGAIELDGNHSVLKDYPLDASGIALNDESDLLRPEIWKMLFTDYLSMAQALSTPSPSLVGQFWMKINRRRTRRTVGRRSFHFARSVVAVSDEADLSVRLEHRPGDILH